MFQRALITPVVTDVYNFKIQIYCLLCGKIFSRVIYYDDVSKFINRRLRLGYKITLIVVCRIPD